MTQNENLQEKRGIKILHDPTLNKSTAFTKAEREALDWHIAPHVQ